MKAYPLDIVLIASLLFAALAWTSRSPLASTGAEVRDAEPQQPNVGDSLVGFRPALGVDAELTNTIVAFYSVECPWSRASIPFWKQLREAVNPDDAVQFLAVSVSDSQVTAVQAKGTGFTWPIRTRGPSSLQEWNVTRVPLTLLIDGTGHVEHVWRGVVREETLEQILGAIEAVGRAEDG